MSPNGPQRSGATDDALLRAARLGDEEAFAVLVDRHAPGMYRYALRLVGGSDADAKEVTQEALISAWKGLDTFAGRSSLRTWLFRLVHRRAADLQRHRRPTPIDDELLSAALRPAEDNPLRDALDSELLAALQAALDELPWHQRAAWLLFEIEGLSYDEIAAALDLSTGSVRGHLHRGRRTLAERMERWR
ncbi:sigma-70 family RNA polymerase sigma factor [Nocardioides sp. ChNu-153]|uniref:RNA polymerase sigma factor n=1 Tax=unclassified Nocardioides TaxID=2615069 RepID=UPI0024066E4E|nr:MULTISPECIES: sigma-70 family RNA polymerase sigma factor [unclassified Nocardioides]MDF9714751.1 sigma-70 family RNA polymerase sigma factor [Nocardioides sp. ChNu-99]MDN7120122.1 sigma-70 family RNA polymerase sigma factor [Nocardioides sp. ChNu-153]